MVHLCWLIRAVTAIEGFNALGQPATLAPHMRGWVLREKALEAAVKGDVIMLSPGGLEALRTRQTEVLVESVSEPVVVDTEKPTILRAPLKKSAAA